jgi:predicted dehydrogenase
LPSKLRVAVAGVGWFGGVHANVWSALPGIELVGLADPAFASAATPLTRPQDDFHRDAGGSKRSRLDDVPRFESVAELLESVRPDLVDITTPEEVHVEVALECIAGGAHVVVEKPVALDPLDVERLAVAGSEHGRFVFPAHVLRFDGRYAAVRERLTHAGAGLRLISTQRHFQQQAHAVYGRVHPALNALIHDVDVALWFAGGRPDRVRGYSRIVDGDARSPRLVSAVLEWAAGPTALLENAWHLVDGMSTGYEFRCTVMHDDFTAIVAPAADVALYGRGGEAVFPDVHLWPSLQYGVSGALRSELMHFATCVASGEPSSIVGLGDAFDAVLVACSIRDSIENDMWVEVGTHSIETKAFRARSH